MMMEDYDALEPERDDGDGSEELSEGISDEGSSLYVYKTSNQLSANTNNLKEKK